MKDYYLILGIEPNATFEEVKKAYKAMSMKYHPDKNQGDKYFEERFKDINEAYEILSDNEKRKAHDYQRMGSYKKSSSTNSNANSGSDKQRDFYNQKEQEIKKKEQQLRQFEQLLKNKEAELLKIAEGLNIQKESLKSSDNSKLLKVAGIGLIAIFLFFLFTRLTQEVLDLKQQVEHLKYQRDSLNLKIWKDDLGFIPNEGKDNKSNQSGISEKKKTKSRKQPSFLEEDVSENEKKVSKPYYLPNRVLVMNSPELEFSNVEWENYFDGERSLKNISVFNKTLKSITEILVKYEVNDPKGIPINSGEFTLFKYEKIEAGRAKVATNEQGFLTKRTKDILILHINGFKTAD